MLTDIASIYIIFKFQLPLLGLIDSVLMQEISGTLGRYVKTQHEVERLEGNLNRMK